MMMMMMKFCLDTQKK